MGEINSSFQMEWHREAFVVTPSKDVEKMSGSDPKGRRSCFLPCEDRTCRW